MAKKTCPNCYSTSEIADFDISKFCSKCGKEYAAAFRVTASESTPDKPSTKQPKFKITVRSEDDEPVIDDNEETDPSQFKWTVAAQGGTETDSDGRVRLKKFTIGDWAKGFDPAPRNPGNVQGDVLAQKLEWMQSKVPINVGLPQPSEEGGE